MSLSFGRRAFLQGIASLVAFGIAGCAGEKSSEDTPDQAPESEGRSEEAATEQEDMTEQGEPNMQISVTVNNVLFTATIEDSAAGQELLARLPLTLSMEELHGNEKYCYTGEAFGGEQYVPDTIEAGDLMVFGSDCLVLFYETFANGGWSYARVGRIDDPSGLADACGGGLAEVTFEPIA